MLRAAFEAAAERAPVLSGVATSTRPISASGTAARAERVAAGPGYGAALMV